MATRSTSSIGQKSSSSMGSRATKSAVFGQGSADKNKKKTTPFGIPLVETPKQLQRRFLKLYERNCAADDCKVLNSIKKTLREGIQLDSLQARVSQFFQKPVSLYHIFMCSSGECYFKGKNLILLSLNMERPKIFLLFSSMQLFILEKQLCPPSLQPLCV